MKRLYLKTALFFIMLNAIGPDDMYCQTVLTNVIDQNWQNGAWVNRRRQTFETVSDLQKKLYIDDWDADSGTWIYSDLRVTNLNPDQTANEVFFNYNWNSTLNAFDSVTWTQYTYTSTGKLETETTQSSNGSGWENGHQYVNIYDSQDRMITQEIYYWYENDWDLFERHVFTYNEAGQWDTQIVQYPYNSSWVSGNYASYEYTDTGKLSAYFYEYYHYENGEISNHRSVYNYNTYDEDAHLIETLARQPDGDSIEFQDYEHHLFSYNTDGKIVQDLFQDDHSYTGTWNNYSLRTYYYGNLDVAEVKKPEIVVFPNPVISNLTLQSNQDFYGSSYTVLDQSGKTIMTGNLQGRTPTLNVEQLAAGIYILQVGKGGTPVKVIKK